MIAKHYFDAHFTQKQTTRKFSIFDQSHGLTPLKKSQYGDLSKYKFLYSKRACFLPQRSSNIITRPIFPKTNKDKFPFFVQNHWLALKRCQCGDYLKSLFLSFRRAWFLTRWSSDIISGLILPKKKTNKQRGNLQFLTIILG